MPVGPFPYLTAAWPASQLQVGPPWMLGRTNGDFHQMNGSPLLAAALVILVRRWILICTGGIIAGAVPVYLVLSQPTMYLARADVVPNRARTQVSYDTRIRTVAGSGSDGSSVLLPAERRQALMQLVENPDVEYAVQQELKDKLPAQLLLPGQLLPHVRGSQGLRSDLINITAEMSTPELAADVASSWSRAYERHVNQLFSDTSGLADIDIEARVKESRERYLKAADELAAFESSTQVDELGRELDRKLSMVDDRQVYIRDLARVARRVDLLLQDASALEQQLAMSKDNGGAASTAAALTLLKTQAFTEVFTSLGDQGTVNRSSASPISPLPSSGGSDTSSGGTDTTSGGGSGGGSGGSSSGTSGLFASPFQNAVQIQLPLPSGAPATLEQQRADIAATILAMQDWRERLRAATADRSLAQVITFDSSGRPITAAQLEQELRELRGKITLLASQRTNLERARNLAFNAYSSLLAKAEEARVARAIGTGNEVSVANRRVVAAPKPRKNLLVLTFMAVTVGLLFAASAVLAAYFAPLLYRQGTRGYVGFTTDHVNGAVAGSEAPEPVAARPAAE